MLTGIDTTPTGVRDKHVYHYITGAVHMSVSTRHTITELQSRSSNFIYECVLLKFYAKDSIAIDFFSD